MYINNSDHTKFHKKIPPTHLVLKYVCKFLILRDEYYFVTNIPHMLKFTNVCGSFFFNDFLKSKSNPIYFKQIQIIQNVMFIFT